MKNIRIHLQTSAERALMIAGSAIAILSISFFMLEPVVTRAVASDTETFRIRQTITDESSFLLPPVNVTMNGSLNGVTGGNATGTTNFVVQSNNAAGYTVEIAFFNNGGANAMIGDNTGSEAIRDYNEFGAGTDPTFAFTPSTSAQFGYTVYSSSTLDTADAFLYDGGNLCNNGGTLKANVNTCYMEPLTTGFVIVDTNAPAVTGATTTLQFRVNVPSGATPVPTAETYTATATLSLFIK